MEREIEGTELPVLRRTRSFTAASPKTKIKRYIDKPNQNERYVRKEDCPEMLAKLKERLARDKHGRTIAEATEENYTWMVDMNTLQEFQRVHEKCDKFRNNPNTPVDDESVGIHTPDAEWGETKGETKGEGSRRTKRREHKRRKKTSRRKLRRGKKTKGKPHRSKPKKKTRGKRRN